ncbi:hypothetical protein C4Z92_18285 [Clostridioides difficile]|uniref:Uncharacterized protein n=1 Tax=Clostridioides difficile (strain 630) TaxID=272563 RepID=F3Y5T3_CLOD6|nr:hypothetical protein [Clostridioides difficile]OFU32513.1 hypothetical protein HMPREF3076_03440 [Clostridium sp. HMSC19B12]CCA62798.1 conserved hypothetical protein [Clostridioides difficile 630]CCL09632.1 Conserved hypothetical protein [Clostridioides difficile E16]CCL67304.1 Conserved hypothetical protein [Clostridioides difficile E7]CCL70949.1 Conserved hypothetical protein [Clostridioides difficile T3]CCL74578.1 Conserved hypothetical protein [Clostridioides difficile E28]CCL94411.1 C
MMGIFILDYYKTFIILISISLVKRVKRNPYKSSKDLINGNVNGILIIRKNQSFCINYRKNVKI